jgi:pyruvate dehydrogenase E1 component
MKAVTADWELAREWIDSAEELIAALGPEEAAPVLGEIATFRSITPSRNSVPPLAPENDGPLAEIERYVRWNAAQMVQFANHLSDGIGGHLSTYASSSTLFSVAWDHHLHGRSHEAGGDHVFWQGHASPGVYARAFLEGRLSREELFAFRREHAENGGLSSYPHPRLMPEFWEFPTVSMGLGPISAIHQAVFDRYLLACGLRDTSQQRVWSFLGDGECDEPESLGLIRQAARARLSNLVFVVSCNLQRLDGPTSGSYSTINELASLFRGAGWNVIECWWGQAWEPLLAREPRLAWHLARIADGDLQRLAASATADQVRTELLGEYAWLVDGWDDAAVAALPAEVGGHCRASIHAAYTKAAASDRPTAVLARTVKGRDFPHAGRNAAHQIKKLDEAGMLAFAENLNITLSADDKASLAAHQPVLLTLPAHLQTVLDQLVQQRGVVPSRSAVPATATPNFAELDAASKAPASTTAVLTRALKLATADTTVVPVVADEGRTFGFDPLYSSLGVFSPESNYTPVDAALPLRYRESSSGRFLQAGISEASAMALFQAAGSSHATHRLPTLPWYTFYSMFGVQRVGDQIWQAADARCRGLLVGATAGRTTLPGEGLQHQDGNSLAWATAIPYLNAFDCAFSYELYDVLNWQFARWRDGHEEMNYLVAYNEAWDHPSRPQGVTQQDVVSGGYVFAPSAGRAPHAPSVALLFSGPSHLAASSARDELAEVGVHATLISITSYKALWLEALDAERQSLATGSLVRPRITELLEGHDAAIAVSDWSRSLPSIVAPFSPVPFRVLGTDGFGRSEDRDALRRHFNVQSSDVTAHALHALRASELSARAHALASSLSPRFSNPGAHRADF